MNRRKDGTLYEEEMAITPLTDDEGAVTHFVAIKRDMSARKRAESVIAARERELSASESRFRALLEHAPEAVFVADGDGEITMVNVACGRLLGYSRGELVGRSLGELLPRAFYEQYLAGRQHALGGTSSGGSGGGRSEISVLHRDGTRIPVEASLSFAPGLSGAWALCHMADLRPRQAADRAKREFLSVVSHELRTPLTSIRGSLGLLAVEAGGSLPTEAQSLVRVAHSNSERLLRLINDMLDFEKLERGEVFRTRQVDLVNLVSEAIDANRGYAQQYGVGLRFHGESVPAVEVDPDRLQQVLANLLSNAAKYSPRGGHVSVTVSERGGACRVTVHNEGPPIPQEFRDQVFERFAQADATDSRLHGGSGLGLAISKTIIERHGGAIGFESPEFGGVTFYFELPARECHEAHGVPEASTIAARGAGE